jgi:hypothetical protein
MMNRVFFAKTISLAWLLLIGGNNSWADPPNPSNVSLVLKLAAGAPRAPEAPRTPQQEFNEVSGPIEISACPSPIMTFRVIIRIIHGPDHVEGINCRATKESGACMSRISFTESGERPVTVEILEKSVAARNQPEPIVSRAAPNWNSGSFQNPAYNQDIDFSLRAAKKTDQLNDKRCQIILDGNGVGKHQIQFTVKVKIGTLVRLPKMECPAVAGRRTRDLCIFDAFGPGEDVVVQKTFRVNSPRDATQ